MDEDCDHLADTECAFCTDEYSLDFAELILSASATTGLSMSADKFNAGLGKDLRGN